jgi:DNA gyrase/topoisomerase IV subunit B
MSEINQYTEDNIRSLDWKEHIRMRPGMYIGKLGDGSSPDDGIYILLKEVIDNCIDEFVMGAGKTIEVAIKDKTVSVRDYGRGIPLGESRRCGFKNEYRRQIRFTWHLKIGRTERCRYQSCQCAVELFPCRIGS